jgi:hypothetical protein
MTSLDDPNTVGSDPDEELLSLVRLDPAQLDATVKIPLTVQCHKPPRHDFIRVHPQLRIDVGAIQLKDDQDAGLYLVTQAMTAELEQEVKSFCLRPYVYRSGVLRLWPIRLPGPDGRVNEWHRTAAKAAEIATHKWVRVTSNQSLKAYEVFEAPKQPPDPEWPDLTLPDMIRLAFQDRGRIIRDAGHPVVKRLLGSL